jgi:WD40 repeat protein
MADVFVSYSRQDSAFVGRLVSSIEGRGKQVWRDTDGIADGEVFPQAIRTAIEQSDAFLFVITPAAVQSAYCENEVEYARELKKRIVPVLRLPVPDPELPAEVRDRSWIPFTDRDDYEPSLERLVAALDRDLKHAKEHTRWLVKAIEWDNERRDTSFLLRGSELKAAEAWLAGTPEDADPAPTGLQREYLLASREASARRQRALAGASLTIALVSIGLLVFALISRQQAVSAETVANSRALAAQSETQLAVDPELSILLAMHAVRTSPTPDSLFALRAAIDASPLRMTLLRSGQVNCQLTTGPSIAYDPAAPRLAEGLCGGPLEIGGPRRGGRLQVFDSRDGHVVLRTTVGLGGAPVVAYSPGGSTLAVGMANGGARLLDARSGATRAMLGSASAGPFRRTRAASGGPAPGPGPGTPLALPSALAFSPDGSRLAMITQTQAKLWSVSRGTARTLEGSASPAGPNASPPLYSVAFTRDGRSVVVAGLNGVRVYDARTGALARVLPRTGQAHGVAVSPDGRQLVVAAMSYARGGEGVVSLWSARTWRRTATLAQFPGRQITAVAFSADGQNVAIGAADGSAGVWSVRTHDQLVAYLGSTSPIAAIAFAPDRQSVATAAADGSTQIWRASGPEQASIDTGAGVGEVRLAGNRLLATIGSDEVRTWLMPGASPQPAIALRVPHAGDGIYALSADGSLSAEPFSTQRGGLASGVSVTSTATGRVVHMLAPVSALTTLAFSPDGRRLALIGATAQAVGQPAGLRAAAVVDLTGSRTVGLQAPPGPPGGVAGCQWVSSAMTRNHGLVAAADFCGAITIWDAHTGRLLAQFTNPGEISQIAFAPNGRDLAVGSWDSTITIWDVSTRHPVAVLHGHTLGVDDVAYSPNGALLASASLDDTARIWDPANGRLLRVWREAEPVTSVAFSSDGDQIVTADAVGTIRVWDACTACTDASALLAIAQHRAERQLTPLERATYLSP